MRSHRAQGTLCHSESITSPVDFSLPIETAACLCFTGFSLFPCGTLNDLDSCQSRGDSTSLIGMKESQEDTDTWKYVQRRSR